MTVEAEFLLTLDLFQGFFTHEVELISEYFSTHKFFDLQVIMPQKGNETSVGLILDGEISIIDEQMEHPSRIKGDLLAEMALIQTTPRRADFIAASDGEIAIMTFDDIEKLKLNYPQVAVKFIVAITQSAVQYYKTLQLSAAKDGLVLLADPSQIGNLVDLINNHESFFSTKLIISSKKLNEILCQNTGIRVEQIIIPELLIGGEQAIGSHLLLGNIKAVFYLRDALELVYPPACLEAISRLCDRNQVFFATNRVTVESILHYLN